MTEGLPQSLPKQVANLEPRPRGKRDGALGLRLRGARTGIKEFWRCRWGSLERRGCRLAEIVIDVADPAAASRMRGFMMR